MSIAEVRSTCSGGFGSSSSHRARDQQHRPRRQPLSAYNDFALVAQSPTDYYELYLYNAISKTDSAEISFGDESMAAIKVSLGSRRDGANLALPSWRLRTPA